MSSPKDDEFWYEIASDVVKNSIIRLNDAAAKMYTIITWFFPISTASALFAFTINEPNKPLIYLTPLPYILLAIGVSMSIAAQMPIPVSFIYNVPSSIDKAYQDTFKKKVSKLKLARWFGFLGIIGSSFIIFYSFVLNKKNDLAAQSQKKVKEVYFESNYYDKNIKQDIIALTGYLPPSVPVVVKASFQNATTKKDTLMIDDTFVNTKEGDFKGSFKVPKVKASGKYFVSIEWKDNTYIKVLTKEINVSK